MTGRDSAKSEDLESTEARLAAEWGAYEIARLIDSLDPIQYAVGELAAADTSATPLTAAEIKRVALNRDRIYKAIVEYTFGGAIRLFEAYEELNYEIMEYTAPDQVPGRG